jgi:heat shock protein HslJ
MPPIFHHPSGARVLRGLMLGALLGLGACAAVRVPPDTRVGAPSPAAASALMGSEWRLLDLHGRPALDGVSATLAFPKNLPQEGRLHGHGSCNRFSGSVSVDTNHHMQIGQIASTRMACPGPVGEQENRYLAALQQVHHFDIQGPQLLLYVQGQNLPLRFERTGP